MINESWHWHRHRGDRVNTAYLQEISHTGMISLILRLHDTTSTIHVRRRFLYTLGQRAELSAELESSAPELIIDCRLKSFMT